MIRRTLDGRIKIAPDGTVRASDRYLLVGRKDAARPDTVQAAWLYAQMVRWGQAPLSAEMLAAAKAVFRPDLFDAALPDAAADLAGEPADGIGAFAGPPFDADDIAALSGGMEEQIRRADLLQEPDCLFFALHKIACTTALRLIRFTAVKTFLNASIESTIQFDFTRQYFRHRATGTKLE